MDLSIFLARVLGLYLLAAVIELQLRHKDVEKAIKELATNNANSMIIVRGSYSLLVGLMIVLSHPAYTQSWEGLITLAGYLLVLRGVLGVLCPNYLFKKILPVYHRRARLMGLLLLALSAYFIYQGFWVS